MRFLPHESDDFQREIVAHGFNADDFRFVKRQGKLHVFFKQHPLPFKFFRKESTQLDAKGKWEKETFYLLFEGGKTTEVKEWESVKSAFQNWLKDLVQAK